MGEKEYVLQQNESYMDFLQRALGEQASGNQVKMIDVLLEIIIPEISAASYSLTLCHQAGEINIAVSHSGKPIKSDILGILKDQTDRLHYRHQSKDRHTLKISMNIQ
jgi:hypothetical protein